MTTRSSRPSPPAPIDADAPVGPSQARQQRRRWLRTIVAPSVASLVIHAAVGIVIGTVAIGKYMQMGGSDALRPQPVEIVVDFDQPGLNPSPGPGNALPPGRTRDGDRSQASASRRTPEADPATSPIPVAARPAEDPSSSPTSQTPAHKQPRAAASDRSATDHVEGTLNERIAERLAQVNSRQATNPDPNGTPGNALDAGIAARLGGGGGSGPAGLGPADAPPTSFAGLKASNAQSVVYVVDASGSLISTLPVVRRELEQSLRRLAPTQRYAVIFFQRNQAIVQGAAGGSDAATAPVLRTARKAEVDATLAWAATIRPSGRSSPLIALGLALNLRPDVVFLLSTDITGAGDFEVGRDEILRRIDELNPLDPATGRRPTRIQCVQFLDPDPLDTLREIARRHGGAAPPAGADEVPGFRFLTRESLGLGPRGEAGDPPSAGK